MRLFTLLLTFFFTVSLFAQKYVFYALSTDPKVEKPIHLYAFDSNDNTLVLNEKFGGVYNGNYMTISKDKTSLIVTSKSSDGAGLVTFLMEANGYLKKNGETFYKGAKSMPCHVSYSKNEDVLFTANYGGGTVNVWDNKGGNPSITQSIQLKGSGPNKSRQNESHAHFVKSDPSGKYLYAVDLGTDKVMNYVLENGKLTPNPQQAFLKMEPGAGPRHLVFHPTRNLVFVLNELKSSITSCTFNPENGLLSALETVPMLPDTFTGFSKAAAIRVHPSGRFVYGSNRGLNSIAVYKVAKDGNLALVELETEHVDWPRDFQITPDGKYLFCCNLNAHNISIYSVDDQSGKLKFIKVSEKISSPLCIEFIETKD